MLRKGSKESPESPEDAKGDKVTLFYDSVKTNLLPHGLVCLYADGDYAQGQVDLGGYSGVKWITVLGNQFADIADYEPGNAVYEGDALARWAAGRRHQGYQAVVYTDLDNFAQARSTLGDIPVLWWLATLDGNQLSADYSGVWVWGVQYAGGEDADYDTSILYREWNNTL
jgi:hypothetical protein